MIRGGCGFGFGVGAALLSAAAAAAAAAVGNAYGFDAISKPLFVCNVLLWLTFFSGAMKLLETPPVLLTMTAISSHGVIQDYCIHPHSKSCATAEHEQDFGHNPEKDSCIEL
ncbi:Uncharacterized protein TCM_005553 [Theobroma cacao]|uniref:Uncharacterized protein n=1 Tax=Theobroma cacao TaxID=3641 RepID=A0A061DU78_THECC|nr:Uncharacterized protein TCM_005553 [Theobroma cacao]